MLAHEFLQTSDFFTEETQVTEKQPDLSHSTQSLLPHGFKTLNSAVLERKTLNET